MYSFELPSGSELELREMTGAEEELLTNAVRLVLQGRAHEDPASGRRR